MDTCGVCGAKRSPELRFTKVRDGWVCKNCIKESALIADFPDWQYRSKVISRMTVGDMRERIESNKKRIEDGKSKTELAERLEKFIVTTVDLHRDYEVICPVFFQTSNKGVLSSSYSDLARNYNREIERRRVTGEFSEERNDYMWLWFGLAGMPIGQNDFEPAFYIGIEEIKMQAIKMGADAIVGLHVDFDLDTTGFQFFYLHMYGTAVRFTD